MLAIAIEQGRRNYRFCPEPGQVKAESVRSYEDQKGDHSMDNRTPNLPDIVMSGYTEDGDGEWIIDDSAVEDFDDPPQAE